MLNTRRQEKQENLKPDPAIGAILRQADTASEILPWSKVLAIVEHAPAAPIPWYYAISSPQRRPVRFALAPLVLMLALGVLWVMPAQSDNVGTLVLTTLPAAWSVGSAAFTEVEQAARSEFAKLSAPDSELYIKVGPGTDRDQLGFAMLNVDQSAAEGFYRTLAGRYPALQAFTAEFHPIDSERFGNRLIEIYSRVTRAPRAIRQDNGALRLYILKELQQAGFRDIQVEVIHGGDGRITVQVDAVMNIDIAGHTQEELAAAGLSEAALGTDVYSDLLRQQAATDQ